MSQGMEELFHLAGGPEADDFPMNSVTPQTIGMASDANSPGGPLPTSSFGSAMISPGVGMGFGEYLGSGSVQSRGGGMGACVDDAVADDMSAAEVASLMCATPPSCKMAMAAANRCLNPQPSTLNPQPSTLNPQPSTLNPQPSILNPKPSALNPQPSTPNSKP